jgi:hypothetical protein
MSRGLPNDTILPGKTFDHTESPTKSADQSIEAMNAEKTLANTLSNQTTTK